MTILYEVFITSALCCKASRRKYSRIQVYKLRTVMAERVRLYVWKLFKTNTAEESFLIQVGQLETACYVLRSCDGREVKALG